MKWQPIETAPTNTSVLILTKNGIFEAHATEYSGLWWFAKDPRDGGVLSLEDVDPTHWMPLPNPPKGE